MPNLRIISDNAAKRATITASSQAGSLSPDRLKTPVKTKIWRSTGTTATLTVVLPTAETVDCVALPYCNLSSTSTLRVQGYATTGAATASFDTGDKPACPYMPFNQFDWGGQPLGVNAFSYGAASQGVIWFTATQVQKLVITITDTLNPLGYIEAACLVTGLSWSPKFNPGYGAGVLLKDTTKNERSESGNLRSDRGTMSKSLSIDLKNMIPTDRNKLWNMMLGNGLSSPAFISLYPESSDVMEEQIHQMYGKLTQQAKLSLQSFGITQAPLEVEEI